MTEPESMTFEDLSAMYRTESKSAMLSEVRQDMYPAMAKLQEGARKAYEEEHSKDPDSIMCEGMNERRKKVAVYVQKVIDLRMGKIATMALRTSMGANNTHEKFTPEELEYYRSVVEGSKKLRTILIKDAKRYTIPDISVPPAAKVSPPEHTVKHTPKHVSEHTPEGRAEAEGIEPDHLAEARDTGPPAETDIGLKRQEEAGPEHTADDTVSEYGADADIGQEEELIRIAREEISEDMVVIRMLEDIPERISGPECDYDLRKEDIVRMPVTLAKALINHEKAMMLNVTP
jgi:DNA replication factor GINS